MASLWGAEQIGEKKRLGSIEPGKYADLVVIDKDYMTIPEDQIGTIKPVMTLLEGKIVYEAGKGEVIAPLVSSEGALNGQ